MDHSGRMERCYRDNQPPSTVNVVAWTSAEAGDEGADFYSTRRPCWKSAAPSPTLSSAASVASRLDGQQGEVAHDIIEHFYVAFAVACNAIQVMHPRRSLLSPRAGRPRTGRRS